MKQSPVVLCCNSAVLSQVGREACTFDEGKFARGRAASFALDVCVAFFTACSQAGESTRLPLHMAPNRCDGGWTPRSRRSQRARLPRSPANALPCWCRACSQRCVPDHVGRNTMLHAVHAAGCCPVVGCMVPSACCAPAKQGVTGHKDGAYLAWSASSAIVGSAS
jgi:hypothetical protein